MDVPVVVVESAFVSPQSLSLLFSDLSSVLTSLALLIAFFSLIHCFRLIIPSDGVPTSFVSPSISYSSSSDYDDDDSSVYSDDTEEEDEEESLTDVYDESTSGYGICEEEKEQDGNLTNRPCWATLGCGGGSAVVRTWEGLGLGFDGAGGLISLVDLNRGEVLRSFLEDTTQTPAAMSLVTPAVVLSATPERIGPAAVKVWDAREAEEKIPAAAAEWRGIRRRVVRVACGGNGRVYVGDDAGGVAMADLRNGRSPPVVRTWSDADAANHFLLLPSPK